jgi:hypothetical protein
MPLNYASAGGAEGSGRTLARMSTLALRRTVFLDGRHLYEVVNLQIKFFKFSSCASVSALVQIKFFKFFKPLRPRCHSATRA